MYCYYTLNRIYLIITFICTGKLEIHVTLFIDIGFITVV